MSETKFHTHIHLRLLGQTLDLSYLAIVSATYSAHHMIFLIISGK
jgi:hypothetical protein